MYKTTKFLFVLIFYLGTYNCIIAQPHLEGNIFIDTKTGYWKCELTVSNIPKLQEYKILLNKGMNIKFIKDSSDALLRYKGYYNGEIKGEAIGYYLVNHKGKSKPINQFTIEYVGAFPVYKNEFNTFDFKGYIANNGLTLRAAEQTKWYPVLYDVTNDRIIYDYTYNLQISLDQKKSIFINGNPPIKADNASFKTEKPRPLMLFIGDYHFIEHNGNYILNDTISKTTADAVFKNINLIKVYLQELLQATFKDKIYLINHKAVNKRKEGSSWGFNTYPAFAFTDVNFQNWIVDGGTFSHKTSKYLGHEFSHNYFGHNVMSGKLFWFWLESFPEYLSFRVVEHFADNSLVNKLIIKKVEQINKSKDDFKPLPEITSIDEINNTYRYVLGPLILKCFEIEFGKEKLDFVMQKLLAKSHHQTLTLDLFRQMSLNAGIKRKKYQLFYDKYIKSKDFKTNIINRIETSIHKN